MTNTNKVILLKGKKELKTTVNLPASKSISNRAIIVNALGDGSTPLKNLSSARDTQLMLSLINREDQEINAMDAGTTMRFLTAYFSSQGIQKKMTGTPRMCKRPIGILVDALRQIGVEINYLKETGYPPLEINGFNAQQTNSIEIAGNISSQFISAMLMIAPCLPNGLNITLTGKVGSVPYIQMTLDIMKTFGASVEWKENTIKVNPTGYTNPETFAVEPDWSAASYWYSITALSAGSVVFLPGLKKKSLQGDAVVAKMMEQLGVKTTFTCEGVTLENVLHQSDPFKWDFTNCPDLAQTIAVLCAAKGIRCEMTGLESLRIKETDRIAALQNELRKFGANLYESGGKWIIDEFIIHRSEKIINTYEDHRMAMAFAPLCMLYNLEIEEPEVVRKSYPHFWQDMKKVVR
ncbi:MAG: 3-phosphoshikimate 1-carboxyvinyltransferase [Cyclobacteriaceae bacterium]|nr:3-phosphoshikimate 1-carboxyvinyltransferase [Cyclobacteriaceae bacterium]